MIKQSIFNGDKTAQTFASTNTAPVSGQLLTLHPTYTTPTLQLLLVPLLLPLANFPRSESTLQFSYYYLGLSTKKWSFCGDTFAVRLAGQSCGPPFSTAKFSFQFGSTWSRWRFARVLSLVVAVACESRHFVGSAFGRSDAAAAAALRMKLGLLSRLKSALLSSTCNRGACKSISSTRNTPSTAPSAMHTTQL
jgi:hypothetical protein